MASEEGVEAGGVELVELAAALEVVDVVVVVVPVVVVELAAALEVVDVVVLVVKVVAVDVVVGADVVLVAVAVVVGVVGLFTPSWNITMLTGMKRLLGSTTE